VVKVDASAMASFKFRLRFRFATTDCAFNSGTGPFIDDVSVQDLSCANDAMCDDKNACTSDTCDVVTALCKNEVKVCDDKNACTNDTCDPKTGLCGFANKPDASNCSDGDSCTTGDTCYAGKCMTKVKCDDGNPCTADTCSTSGVCAFKPVADGEVCSDGDPCTGGESCTVGACKATSQTACTVLASDAFACGASNWAIDPAGAVTPSWAIDGTPFPPGFKSPECSLNFNNGKDFACGTGQIKVQGTATSVSYDLTAAKAASLELFSWTDTSTGLTSDFRWIEVSADEFQTTPIKIWLDNAFANQKKWFPVKVDLSSLAGKKVKVRFRFDSGDCSFNSGTGWFVDDLKLTTDIKKGCTQDSECNDGNVCSDDSCAAGSCVVKYNTAPCNDNNVCSEGDVCNGAGLCSAGTKAKACDDANPCTTDTCDQVAGCKNAGKDDGSFCSDLDACTKDDVCLAAKCVAKAKCDDGNPCTVDSCATSGACTNKAAADGVVCSDNDACTAADVCAAGLCKGTSAPCSVAFNEAFACGSSNWAVAPAGDPTAWAIDATPLPPGYKSPSCSLNFNNGTNFLCAASGQSKVAGTAASKAINLSAAKSAVLQFFSYGDVASDDGTDLRFVEVSADNFQTVLVTYQVDNDFAQNKKWNLYKVDLAAAVGKSVQIRFRFDSGNCLGNSGTGWFVDDVQVSTDVVAACKSDAECDDKNACTDNVCNAGKCEQKNNTATCDDLNPCTTGEVCGGGACLGGTALVCNDKNDCTTDSCSITSGCVYVTKADAAFCSDGDSCTTSDTCLGGKCVGKTASDGSFCSDGDSCTSGDSCKAGKCTATGAAVDGSFCSDSNPCTVSDSCKGGKCGGAPACDDKVPCTADSCEIINSFTNKCTFTATAEGATCDDGDACTPGDVCKAGSCSGGVSVCTQAFFDPFECAKPLGWTTSGLTDNVGWKIDGLPNPPGFKSPSCSMNYNNDTNYDALGANGSPVSNKGETVSPSILVPAKGESQLKFWYFFDTESGGFDAQFVDVSDNNFGTGTVSQQLNTNFTNKNKWVQHTIATSKFAGKSIKVRFRFDSGDATNNGGKGAFVDDVLLQGAADLSCKANSDCQADSNPCTDAACQNSACVQLPNAVTACDDGDACTTGTACASGKCEGAKPLDCNDGNPCTADSCDKAKGCVNVADPKCALPLPYEKKFSCASADNKAWQLGAGQNGSAWAFDATPAEPGTFGDAATDCSLNFNNGKDFLCTGDIEHDASATSPQLDGTKLAAGSVVEVRFRVAGSWENNSFDDLLLEVSVDTGQTWAPVDSYNAPPVVSGKYKWESRTADLSKAVLGKFFRLRFRFKADCFFSAKVGPFIDDLKVYDATCKLDSDCSDDEPCTDGSCDVATGKCAHKANSKTCDDGNSCTEKDVCGLGTCGGTVKACNDSNDCTLDSCDLKTGGCNFVAKADAAFCSDNNSCTDKDACLAGKCVATAKADGSTCSDNNVCTGGNLSQGPNDSCKAGVCVAGVGACEDGNVCTTNTCSGTVSKSCTVSAASDKCSFADVLAENFELCDKTQGWTLDPATGSLGWAFDGTPDPPKAKNGVCSMNFNDGKTYAAASGKSAGNALSPAVAVPAAKTAVLTFWSYAGFEENYETRKVEVVVAGVVVQTISLSTTADLGKWVQHGVDLSAQAGKTVQLRFAFDTKDGVANSGPGWFVDDVKLSAGAGTVD